MMLYSVPLKLGPPMVAVPYKVTWARTVRAPATRHSRRNVRDIKKDSGGIYSQLIDSNGLGQMELFPGDSHIIDT